MSFLLSRLISWRKLKQQPLESGMGRVALWLGGVGLLGAGPGVQHPHPAPSFAGLTWLAGPAEVRQHLQRRGFVFHAAVRDAQAKDSFFFGQLMNKPVTVQALFNDHRQLVKISVVFAKNKDSRLLALWKRTRMSLERQYGRGQLIYSLPAMSEKDERSLRKALAYGKRMSELWLFPGRDDQLWLSVRRAYANRNDVFLVLTYQAADWPAELRRRNQIGVP